MKKYRVRLFGGTILLKTNDRKLLEEVIDKLKLSKKEYVVETNE